MTMKKTYIEPFVIVEEISLTSFVCGSQDISSNLDITYGGVDENGTEEPESRRMNAWHEEDEEMDNNF